MSFACRCCGHRTLEQEPPGTWLTCPVCCWQDAPEGQPGANPLPLLEAQDAFAVCGASAPDWVPSARPATPEEAKPDGWLTLRELREAVVEAAIESLERAFGDVRRDGGVSLHQMNVLDDYGDADALARAELEDGEERWQTIDDDKLERFGASLVFLDAKGFRFYIPAFLRLMARRLSDLARPCAFDGVWSALVSSHSYASTHYTALDDAQRRAIATFLRGVVEIGDDEDRAAARESIDRYWGRYG